MQKKRVKFILIGLLVAHITSVAVARYTTVSSNRSLDKKIARNKFAILLVYQLSRQERKDQAIRRAIQELQDTFRAISDYDLYRRASAAFISANVAKRNICTLLSDIDVATLPAVLLYHNGTLVEDAQGRPFMLKGFFSYDQLQVFINKYLKREMRTYAQWKAKETRRIVADYGSCGYGPYWYPAGWYYPYDYYWGWGYPYSRPWYYW